MRLRERRRIEKLSRIAASRRFAPWRGVPSPEQLLQIALDPEGDSNARAAATNILSRKKTPQAILDAFLTSPDTGDLIELGWLLENLGRPNAVEPLIRALYDAVPERREQAAMALGWNRRHCPPAARALAATMIDKDQPRMVRLRACWALSEHSWPRAIPALITVLSKEDVQLRFAAVRALGSVRNQKSHRLTPQAKAALESRLDDQGLHDHNWWTVGKEALANLAFEDEHYMTMLRAEIDRIRSEAEPSQQDKMLLLEYGDL